MKTRNAADQFQLIPENQMPYNLAGETLPPEPEVIPQIITCKGSDIFGNPTIFEITYKPLHPNTPNCWPKP